MTTVLHAPRLILASASPARFKLLKAAGINADVIVSHVDESLIVRDTAQELSETLARLKAEAVASTITTHPQHTANDTHTNTLVLGCDSVLAFQGHILGKPHSPSEATQRWRDLRGNEGTLHTGHCLIDVTAEKSVSSVASTIVRFADVTEHEIAAYVATGEPLDVAGAFTIDGLGGVFIDSIDGDAGTVIGLSLPTLRRLLHSLGHSITSFWTPTQRPA